MRRVGLLHLWETLVHLLLLLEGRRAHGELLSLALALGLGPRHVVEHAVEVVIRVRLQQVVPTERGGLLHLGLLSALAILRLLLLHRVQVEQPTEV